MSKFQSTSTRQCQTICEFTRPAFSNLESLCTFRNSLIHISSKYSCKRCSPLFLTGSNSNKLLTITVLLLAGDIETNPGPEVVQNTFPCGLCEVDANWSNGGIACESCDVWYHRSCADLNMSSFNRLASSSRIWICAKCHSSNFSHYPFHYSLLYLTVSNSFDPISALDSDYSIFSPDPSTPAFQPKLAKVYSTPTSTSPGSQAQNTFSTPSFDPPTFSSIVTPDLVSSTIDTPTENSSDGSTVPYSESTVPRKDNNWRTLVINANSIANKKAELAAIAEYCDPDLMLISETKLSPDILNGEFVPEGYMGRFRKDRKRGAGGVMIISKDCYKIVDADITVQNENESVWAIITLKDLSKLVVGSFYRPPDRGIQPLLDLEIELAQISEKFRNNPKTTLILGGDFNAGGINWDNCTVDHDAKNRPLKEKLTSILDEAGLKQMQREPTRGQNLLDLFCCNKPSLIKSINSIPGISDHNIVLADCKLKPSIITKPQRKIYQWSKADWRSIREQTVVFAENFLASASTRNINENYNTFKEYLEEIMSSKIPTKLSSKRFKLPWFNRELTYSAERNLENIRRRNVLERSIIGRELTYSAERNLENIRRRNVLERSIIGRSIKNFKNTYKVN